MEINKPINIKFGEWKDKAPILELNVMLRWRPNDPKPILVIKPFAFPLVLSPDGTDRAIFERPLTGSPQLARLKRDEEFINPSNLQKACEEHIADVDKRGSAFEDKISELKRLLVPVNQKLAEIKGVENHLQNLKEQKESAPKKKKEELEDKIKATELKLRGLGPERRLNEAKKLSLENEITETRVFLNEGEVANENLKYAEQLSQVMENVANGTIRFRAYFDVDAKIAKRQVVVVEATKSDAGN